MKPNVVIPMAGEGKRFQQAGYTFPKPLIEVGNKTMIQTVVDNLNIDGQYIFIVLREHYFQYNLRHYLDRIAPGCKIIVVDEVTQGAACTVLLAEELINNNCPLVIANADQYVEWDSNLFLSTANWFDGCILTFNNIHPKWSYIKLKHDPVSGSRIVSEVAEKKPISDMATVGIYLWSAGADFVKYAKQMIDKNIRTNGEFYVCPVYNEAIADDKKITFYHIEDDMWGLGTPADLEAFLHDYT